MSDHMTVSSRSARARGWWCTKGKGKVNRCHRKDTRLKTEIKFRRVAQEGFISALKRKQMSGTISSCLISIWKSISLRIIFWNEHEKDMRFTSRRWKRTSTRAHLLSTAMIEDLSGKNLLVNRKWDTKAMAWRRRNHPLGILLRIISLL